MSGSYSAVVRYSTDRVSYSPLLPKTKCYRAQTRCRPVVGPRLGCSFSYLLNLQGVSYVYSQGIVFPDEFLSSSPSFVSSVLSDMEKKQ